MAYKTLDDVNTTKGVHTLITYVAETVPIFTPLMLFAIFIISCLGSYFASIRLSGRGDFPASFAAAGFITTIVATVMSLIPGLINLPILVSCYGIAIVGGIWLYFSRNSSV